MPDSLIPELIEAFGGGGYQETATNEEGETVDNPQTKAQYASDRFDQEIKNHVRNFVLQYRRRKAQQELNKEFEIQ